MASPVKGLMNVASETFFDGRTKDVCAISFPNGLQGSEQRTEQLTMFVLCKSPSVRIHIGRSPELFYRLILTRRGYSITINCGLSGPGDCTQTAVASWRIVPAPNSELDRENAWTRIHLTPMLVAEADRDLYRRTRASIAREAAIMEHVQGWKVRNVE